MKRLKYLAAAMLLCSCAQAQADKNYPQKPVRVVVPWAAGGNIDVLTRLVAALPGLEELHIGHAIVSRAVFTGLREAVAQMRRLIDVAGR